MNTENLEMAIEDAKTVLRSQGTKKGLSWLLTSVSLFVVPIVYFYNQDDSVYRTAYAPLVVGWLMISVWLGNVTARTVVGGRTAQLILSIETATTIVGLAKEKANADKSNS